MTHLEIIAEDQLNAQHRNDLEKQSYATTQVLYVTEGFHFSLPPFSRAIGDYLSTRIERHPAVMRCVPKLVVELFANRQESSVCCKGTQPTGFI